MTEFQLTSLRNNSVWAVYRLRERIDMDPVYQREGGIWNLEKQQLLIDTIINQFDVPKIYLHKFPTAVERNGQVLEYAVIDGKQRLNAIFRFIEGKYALASSFEYLHGGDVKAAKFTYNDLARHYPDIKTDFDSFALDIVAIETDDLELIEDMFSRLNEAVPLNAAEKRNALPGPLPSVIRGLASHPFFDEKLPFTNKRYRHYDLAAKMVMTVARNAVVDTKKAYLDRFFYDTREAATDDVAPWNEEALSILNDMSAIFVDRDPLLRSIGMVTLYFHLFRRAREKNLTASITRPAIEGFEQLRQENRQAAEQDISQADYNILEFDRYTQSPNDGIAMRFRLAVIDDKLFSGALGFELPA
jgi:hypothetical protein